MEYSINLYLSFLVGIVLKIYDDIIDEKLNVNVLYIDFLKYFVITLFSIIFYNDFVFSIIYFEMTILSFLMDKYYTSKLEKSKETIEQKDFTAMNDNIWIYSNILSGIFIAYHIVVNYKGLSSFNIYDYKNITLLVNIIINFFIITFDIYFTPEHSSSKKLYARIFVLLLLSTFVYYMTSFSEYIYEGNYGIMLMHIGFLISSVSFLTLNKYNMFDFLKNNKENKEN